MPDLPSYQPTDNGSSNLDDDFDGDEYLEEVENESDTSSLDELDDSEFPAYFVERNRRLFSSHPSSPYPLPVDTPEQQRLTVNHNILKTLMGANYIGPVANALAPDPRRDQNALDLFTGNGKWVLEMSEEFPHVTFTGYDVVPIATRYPPQNVHFIMHDANANLEGDDGMYDIIHARDALLAIHDYESLLSEVARLLRPDGLFLSVEWGRFVSFHPSLNLNETEHAPASTHFYDTINQTLLETRDLHMSPPQVFTTISNSPHFHRVTSQQYYVPIGGWHQNPNFQRLGLAFRSAQVKFANSCRQMLLDSGMTALEVEDLITNYTEEIWSVDGLMSVVHAVHATRL